jgi:hypothetical protein
LDKSLLDQKVRTQKEDLRMMMGRRGVFCF